MADQALGNGRVEVRNAVFSMTNMTEFKDSENVSIYIKRLKLWIRASKIPDKDRVSTLLTVVGEATFCQLETHFENIDGATEEEIYEELEACYGCKSLYGTKG